MEPRAAFDIDTVHLLAAGMDTISRFNPGDTSIDLAAATSLDAAALGCLLASLKRLADAGFVLTITGSHARARRLFDLTDLVEHRRAA